MPSNQYQPWYRDKFNLLNKVELRIYLGLREAAPAYIVFSQVSMSQLFYIPPRDVFKQIGQIGRKSIDFVLCRQDSSIVMAIEVNGPKHEYQKQKESDDVKRMALTQAGIPLLVLYPDQGLDVKSLRALLAPHVAVRKTYEAAKKDWHLKRTCQMY